MYKKQQLLVCGRVNNTRVRLHIGDNQDIEQVGSHTSLV